MLRQSTTAHVHRLSELLLSTQVTSRDGANLSLDEGADQAVQMILSVKSTSGKIMLIGNGGSAAIVSHMQNDLCKGAGLRAMVFNEPPLLTAFANDHGYRYVFERPVVLWAGGGDVILAISSSGQSENILRAVQAASEQGCQAITFSGFSPDNPLRHLGDVNFYVSSDAYGYVEISHATLAHFLTDCAMVAVRGEELSQLKATFLEDKLTYLARLDRSSK